MEYYSLKVGDQLTFTGSIKTYYKGYYLNQTKDYKIFNPRKVQLVTTEFETFRPKMPNPLTDKNALIGYIMTINKAFYLSSGRPYETWYVDQYQQWHQKHLQNLNKK